MVSSTSLYPRRTLTAGLLAILAALLSVAGGAPAHAASGFDDCFGDNDMNRIIGCSFVIEMPYVSKAIRGKAHARRALAYSLKQDYDNALPDYAMAIELDPLDAMPLNNRAWVFWRLARLEEGLADVEKAIALDPTSHHAFDTRAHIKHSMGDADGALRDYETAIRMGGEKIVKLYQCGLEAQGLYAGPIDGLYTSDVRSALRACVDKRDCDPLPPDEECRAATS
jgi:tetratricopeptide (TPR) repeat protein